MGHGGAKFSHPGFGLLGDGKAGGEEELAVRLLAEIFGQHCFDTAEGGCGGVGKGVIGPPLDDLGAETERLEFLGGEHERREVKARLHAVADAGFAFDGDAGEGQVLDVAVDRPFGDFEVAGSSDAVTVRWRRSSWTS